MHTSLGHLKWQVPVAVRTGNQNIKISFLRGFFDGDGTAINIARFFSTNKFGLLQLASLLSDLNYHYTIQKPLIRPNRKPFYTLQLSRNNQTRFFDEIKPISKLPKLIQNNGRIYK